MKLRVLLFILLLAASISARDLLFPVPTIALEVGTQVGVDLGNYRDTATGDFTFKDVPGLIINLTGDSLFIEAEAGTSGYLPIGAALDGEHITLMAKVRPTEKIDFSFPAKKGLNQVYLMGNFNDWSRTSLPFKLDDDGVWRIPLFLRPGRYEYKFVADGAEILDPANPDSVANGLGGFNSLLSVGEQNKPQPGLFVKTSFAKSADEATIYYKFNPAAPDESVSADNIWILFNNELLPETSWELSGGDLLVQLPESYSDGLLRVCGVNTSGELLRENHLLLSGGSPLSPDTQPGDWHFAVIYSLIVDRFYDGDPDNDNPVVDADLNPMANFQGGDITGIRKKLEEGYFSDLGVSALWISPIIENPQKAYREYIPPQRKYTGYHGYWPVKPRSVDARFGTSAELKRLTRSAHERQMAVLLDFVANHVHEEHPYFKDHRDWFGQLEMPDGTLNLRNWSGETMLTTWFDKFLPSFDYSSLEAVDAVTDDAVFWLREYNFDGFRQDATKHIPHRFWKRLRNKLRKELPETHYFQIGESYGSDALINAYVNPGELDSQFNFEIYFAGRWEFAGDDPDFRNFNRTVARNLDFFQPVNLMGTLTSSHDQVRFMGFADGQMKFDENGTERAFSNPPQTVIHPESYDKLFMFTAVNLSLPGVPVVYYGEEIGQIGANDPDNRRMMRFDDDLNPTEQAFKLRMSKLLHLRREHPSLSLGDLRVIYQDNSGTVWLKQYFDDTLILLFNNSSRLKSFDVPLDDYFTFTQGQSLLDRGMIIPVGNQLTVTLQPFETRIYSLK
ncbi:MAG: hypothetical protein GXO91_02410 [FCB group bacterium]|nr:hypothetical protein [FCB group bacterium]